MSHICSSELGVKNSPWRAKPQDMGSALCILRLFKSVKALITELKIIVMICVNYLLCAVVVGVHKCMYIACKHAHLRPEPDELFLQKWRDAGG